MPGSSSKSMNPEQQILALQDEVAHLQQKNKDLEERLKAYSHVNTGQISLITKLIDKVPFGIMLLDENQLITHANPATGKILSKSTDNMIGKPCSDYFLDYDVYKDNPLLDTKNETRLKHIACVHNDKHIIHSTFVSDEGSEKVIVETFIDITEIKNAEEALLRANKTKDEFLGMISHELRTPLNVIQGFSSLLEDELKASENTEATGYIENISKAGENLLHVVDNLLQLSELTAGNVRVDYIPIEIGTIESQLKYRLENDFLASGNKLVFETEDIAVFEQDLALLMKTLYELLTNANKFTEAGVVTLRSSIQVRDGAEWLCFEVSDTGCGMSEETIQQIFSAFQQADSALNRSYEGLGLGLSLVEKMVTIINGYIKVNSEIGKGTTFSVFLPYQPL